MEGRVILAGQINSGDNVLAPLAFSGERRLNSSQGCKICQNIKRKRS